MAEVRIQAAALCPEIAFHIVGGTPDAVQEWRRFADRQNTADNVFFYGHRPADEIPWFLHAMDVFLAPLQEPAQPLTFMSPLKVPQYLAYGKPIVASNVLPHYEHLEHERTALLTSPTNPAAWAESLQKLRADAALRDRLASNAQKYHRAELTPDKRLQLILKDLD